LISKLTGEKSIKDTITENGFAVSSEQAGRVESALEWLDMSTPVSPSSKTILDAFCDLLQEKLVYEKGERDMVAMHHEFGIKWANGSIENRSSTMIAYGDPNGYSAMAKTVGYPAAIAVDMILKGEIKERGVIAPMSPEIYEPMLKKLNAEGIKFVESVKSG
jgi:saccharopine dehydrogenase-like NADP-dependent oxidoreductase